jgi:hypothetical protein
MINIRQACTAAFAAVALTAGAMPAHAAAVAGTGSASQPAAQAPEGRPAARTSDLVCARVEISTSRISRVLCRTPNHWRNADLYPELGR